MQGSNNNIPEINLKLIYSIRCIGHGLAGLKTLMLSQKNQCKQLLREKGKILEGLAYVQAEMAHGKHGGTHPNLKCTVLLEQTL